jgi:hypothetical protein
MQAAIACLQPFDALYILYGWVGVFEKLMDERDSQFQAQ